MWQLKLFVIVRGGRDFSHYLNNERLSMYGWYSQQQYNRQGGVYYLNENGEATLVTYVTRDATTQSQFMDIKPVGPLGKFIRDSGRFEGSKAFYG